MGDDYWAECGHRWGTRAQGKFAPGYDSNHVCIKPPSHITDITDDDHRCCCGANTWETP